MHTKCSILFYVLNYKFLILSSGIDRCIVFLGGCFSHYLFCCVSTLTACALQFLNERNISHLDLKPQNILLCGSVLKLAGDATPNNTANTCTVDW